MTTGRFSIFFLNFNSIQWIGEKTWKKRLFEIPFWLFTPLFRRQNHEKDHLATFQRLKYI
jgi:hypothetical protein